LYGLDNFCKNQLCKKVEQTGLAVNNFGHAHSLVIVLNIAHHCGTGQQQKVSNSYI